MWNGKMVVCFLIQGGEKPGASLVEIILLGYWIFIFTGSGMVAQ